MDTTEEDISEEAFPNGILIKLGQIFILEIIATPCHWIVRTTVTSIRTSKECRKIVYVLADPEFVELINSYRSARGQPLVAPKWEVMDKDGKCYKLRSVTIETLEEEVIQPVEAELTLSNLKEGERVDYFSAIKAFETSLIMDALKETRGHQGRAARLLGLNPTTLHSKIKHLKIMSDVKKLVAASS